MDDNKVPVPDEKPNELPKTNEENIELKEAESKQETLPARIIMIGSA